MNAALLQGGGPSADAPANLRGTFASRLQPGPEGESFAWMLGGASADRGRAKTPEEAARVAAEEFVAVALVQPILAQLREQNDAAPPFAPGHAERSFGAIFDAEIARRITRKSDFPLVESVARGLLRDAQARRDARPAGATLDRHA